MRTTKKCPTHDGGRGQILPISDFHKDRNALDGHQSRCKACINSARRERYARQGSSARDRFTALRGRAARMQIPFNLSFERYLRLISEPCAYGGGRPPTIQIGPDRVDPKGDYTDGNLVPCCWLHNAVKADRFEFHSMLRIVSEFGEVRNCRNDPRRATGKFILGRSAA